MDTKKHRILVIILLGLFVLTGAAAFPIYNLTKSSPAKLEGMILFLNILCYAHLGKFEKTMLKEWTLPKAGLLNLGIILSGMLCRYLLEFGEVSNTYNFTLPNISLHILATFSISLLAYITTPSRRDC